MLARKPPVGRLLSVERAAVSLHDRLRDRQAQANPSGLAAAGFLEPVERLEHA